MKFLLFISLFFCSGCLVRIGIEDNCDTVTGTAPDKVPDVVGKMKEQQAENVMGPMIESAEEEITQQ